MTPRASRWTFESPDRGSFPRSGLEIGYSVLELLFVVALVGMIGAIAVPQLLASRDRSRGLAAARYLAARMALARTQAVTRAAAVALRFDEGPDGIGFTVHIDGNRNGVLTADIEAGIDVALGPRVRLADRFPGVDIGVVRGAPAADAVHIGRTNLLSFSPAGSATSGTVYVRGRDHTQWGIRVLGPTGRIRLLRFDVATERWADAF